MDEAKGTCKLLRNIGCITILLPNCESVMYDKELGFEGADSTFLYHTRVDKVLSTYSEATAKRLVMSMFLSSFGKYHEYIRVAIKNEEDVVLEFLNTVMEMNAAEDIKYTFDDFNLGFDEIKNIMPQPRIKRLNVVYADKVYADVECRDENITIRTNTESRGNCTFHMAMCGNDVEARDVSLAYSLLLWLGLWHCGIALTNNVCVQEDLLPLIEYEEGSTVKHWHSLYTIKMR